jgi:hypothetical protein
MHYSKDLKSTFIFFCPIAGRAFTFFLDIKSKQKNQEKIIPAFTHIAPKLAAIFSGHRALHFLNFEIFRYNSYRTTMIVIVSQRCSYF